jgi:EAL domain-containing protein (putative c-di-GMP-specific phosphodiesterase class I)
VAEGIETAGQADAVRGQRCAKGQGYFYSRPLASEALSEWLAGKPPLRRSAS